MAGSMNKEFAVFDFFKKQVRRCFKLLKHYWIVITPFVALALWMGKLVWSWESLILTATSLRRVWCPNAWFISLYIELILLFPFFFCVINRRNVKWNICFLLFLIVVTKLLGKVGWIDAEGGILSRQVKMFLIDMPIFIEGMLFFDEEAEQKNDDGAQNIAKKFVEKYYRGRENEYNFYPYLYNFVVGGLNYDFDEAFEFAEKACQRFDYTVNPAQEIMDKWMKGYWKMSDGEAKVNLLKLKDYVAEGKLQDFPSYYSASVFLFKFCEIIDTTILKLLPLFEQGLRKFADNVEVNIAHLSVIKAIGVNKDDVCKPVYDLILKVMEEKIEKQKTADVNLMKELFNKDMQAFCELFIPHDQSSPKFIITPVLHLLDEKDIEKKITVATPEDIMSLYLLVVFRFNSNDKLFHVAEEMPFIERLEKYAILRAEDKKKLSSVIINDQLLPLLKKVKNKYN